MNALIGRLQDGYVGLQSREKLFLSGGALILLLTLTYASFLPLVEKQRQLNDRHEQLLLQLSWLKNQATVVSRLTNSCTGADTAAVTERDTIIRLVRRNQLILGNLTQQTRDYSLNFTASDANAIMRMAYQVACEGLLITRLEIAASNETGSPIAGTMEVSGVN
jgi:type II secretory pathway component PulM